jgi:hypothetical protein
MSNGYEAFKEGPSSDDLKQLAALATRMWEEEQAVAKAEAELETKKKALKATTERDIPELMMKVGVREFVTTTGLRLLIQDLVSCSISEENNVPAVKWLDEHGHGGLVKRVIYVEFPREQEKDAKALLARLKGKFANVAQKATVHPSTLKSWVKEQLTNGKEIPMALFGATQFQKAKIEVKATPVGGG